MDMTIEEIRKRLPDYARDLKLNLSAVLSDSGAPGLEPRQVAGVALASALAAGHDGLTAAIERHGANVLGDADRRAARAAAAVMGMNNVYYRFVHLVEDEEYGRLPAGLRMQVIGNPGVEKVDFELCSLAVSAINGCGMCITAHERVLRKAGLTRQAVQSAVRIAAVVNAVAGTLRHPPAEAAADRAA